MSVDLLVASFISSKTSMAGQSVMAGAGGKTKRFRSFSGTYSKNTNRVDGELVDVGVSHDYGSFFAWYLFSKNR